MFQYNIKKNIFFLFILSYAVLCIAGCNVTSSTKKKDDLTLTLSGGHRVKVLEKKTAATAICRDEHEHYFARATPLDFCLQMGAHCKQHHSLNQEEMTTTYKKFIASSTLDFSKNELDLIKRVFEKAAVALNRLSPTIFPKDVSLIKCNANHYGPSVYYTRENSIIIPNNALTPENEAAFFKTMLHELFHIYSRQNPKKRQLLYAAIGFVKPEHPIQLNDFAKKHALANPDGLDTDYLIKLTEKMTKRDLFAMPFIYSKRDTFVDSLGGFFGHLQFGIVEVSKNMTASNWAIADGTRPRPLQDFEGFFEQIGDNTRYIIHPDEILADNFVILARNTLEPNLTQQYSQNGQRVLSLIKDILLADMAN